MDKRRQNFDDNNDTSVTVPPSRPPLKKRFTGSFNAQPVAPPPPPPAPPVEPEPPKPVQPKLAEFSGNLDDYTKDELLQHMRNVKNEVIQQENRNDSLKEKYLDKQVQESLIKVNWGLIQAHITVMAKILIGTDLGQISEFPSHKMTPEEQKDWCYRNQVLIKELGTKALTRLESWSKQAELIERKYRLEDDIMLKRVIVSDWLTLEIQDLKTSYKNGQQAMNELQRNLDSLLNQSDIIKSNIQVVTTEVDSATERLESSIQELNAAHKRQDRASSKLVAALNYGGLGDMMEQKTSEQNETKEEQKVEVSPKKESVDEPTEKLLKSQLEENKQILQARDKEFDNLKRDRQLLLREEERLLSMFTMGEDRLVETEYVKTLKLSIEHYRDRCYHLEQRRLDIERKMDNVTAVRRQLIDQSKAEKVQQSQTMEAELRRLEGDLNRIRGQRDHFQLLVEEQKAKDAREKEAQEKVVALANQGKQRIAALEQRILELKQSADPLSKEVQEFKQIHDKLSHMQVLLSSLDQIEKRSVSVFSNDAMKQLLDTYKADPTMMEYEQVKTDAQILTMMIEFLEKNESHLLQEIDRVASIYGKLEEQQNKKVFDLAQKKDQALKLQTEKSKYAQTFASLISAKEKQLAVVTSLRTTNDKQQELIKQLEEKERSLEYQVYEKETNIRKLLKTIEEDRTDLEDINHLCEDYRISIDQNEIMLTELQKTLKEKQKLMDEENHLREQAEDACQKMKKKWEKISQGDNPAEQTLIDECEELRALLKCSTCRQRFRTHILVRCMHTFCKNCIDARLETRQRRCPTCSEPFGANDVKNFYL